MTDPAPTPHRDVLADGLPEKKTARRSEPFFVNQVSVSLVWSCGLLGCLSPLAGAWLC
jgi:hypothetical protein